MSGFQLKSDTVKNGVVYRLRSVVGEDVKIYSSNITGAMETPCWFVKQIRSTISKASLGMYELFYMFNLTFVPDVNSPMPEDDCVLNDLITKENFDIIELFDDYSERKNKILIKADSTIESTINDSTLVAVVSYSMMVSKDEISDELMRLLKINEKVEV